MRRWCAETRQYSPFAARIFVLGVDDAVFEAHDAKAMT